MGSGYIIGWASQPFDFATAFKSLSSCYPSTVFTGEYYAQRIEREEELAMELGMDSDAAPLVSIRRAAKRLGPEMSFSVQVSESLTFSGSCSALGMFLLANRCFTQPEVKCLSQCLTSLDMTLEIHCG